MPVLSIITLDSFRGFRKWDSWRQWLNKCVRLPVVVLKDGWGILLEYHKVHKPFWISTNLLIYVSEGLTLPNGMSSIDASRAWTLHPLFMISSHRGWGVNWFYKHSAIMLVIAFGWYVVPKGSWRAVGAFGPSIFISNFTIGHRAWVVTLEFPTSVFHRSCAFLQVIRVLVLATQLTAILHAESQVNCHSFLNLHLCLNRLSRPGRSLLKFKSIMLHVNSLYAEDTEAVRLRAALLASSFELIWILGEINWEARLWNCSQSVNLSTGSEWFLVIIWASKLKTIGRWSESRIWETVTFDSRTFPAGE
jgi:hypothetical protein